MVNIFNFNQKTHVDAHSVAPVDRFAIVDFETTGVFVNRDRIVEVAVIDYDLQHGILEEYTTLVNPLRDVGDTTIHGITATDVAEAPTLQEIVGDLLKRIRNRLVVAHNAQFDMGIFQSELDRIGVAMPKISSLCTLRLAYEFGPNRRRLVDCCSHFEIHCEGFHCAINDARATTSLLSRYMELARSKGLSSPAELSAFTPGIGHSDWPELPESGKIRLRGDSSLRPEDSYLVHLVEKLPDTGSLEVAEYYSALDRVLEDRIVTVDEVEELSKLAIEAGLSKATVHAAHVEYMKALVQVALEDDIVTDSERKDLELVGALLGFDCKYVDDLIDTNRSIKTRSSVTVTPIEDLKGKTVCFTGTITCTINGETVSRDMANRIVDEHGLVPMKSLTKKTDILVVADPKSLSGKASKARSYGTRIIKDSVFFGKLGVKVD